MKSAPICFFFIPGLSDRYRSGGLLVTRDIADLLKKNLGWETYLVATHENHPEAISPIEVFKKIPSYQLPVTSYFFIVTWGPLVEDHIKLIRKNVPHAKIIYYAQSFGWGINIPKDIPIVCVSRFVMSCWAAREPERFYTYMPPPLDSCFILQDSPRDIDILVHTRKQNDYCLAQLLPKLQSTNYKLQTIRDWISRKKFAELLKRTKLFLYLTKSHKVGLFRKLPAEGFGLPALEAIACGALVGTNLLGGVTDFLTPGENCIKLQTGSPDFDIKQIKRALVDFSCNKETSRKLTDTYSHSKIAEKWGKLLAYYREFME